jgi:hypothetical protein
MMKHQPDLTRPMTEIERVWRGIEPKLPEDLPMPVQVPGFRDPNDPRIPTALREAAIAQARRQHQLTERKKPR